MITDNSPTEKLNSSVETVTLPGGRRLGYSLFGPADGKPVLYCHGHPGSRLDLGMFGEGPLWERGLRMIAPDRPGIGASGFQPGYKVLDWPGDVTALADALGLDRFAVLGVSAGGLFAAATAYALPERVTKLALVSSVAPFDVPGATQGMGPGLTYFRLARYLPPLSRLQLSLMASGLKSGPDKMAAQVKTGMPEADAAVLTQPVVIEGFLTTMNEFLRQAPNGPVREAGLYVRPWEFRPEEIRVPTYLWHGEADRNAPIGMGRYLANAIPGCVAKFVPGEAHFSLAAHYLGEIVETLAK